jgi:hypothetical protein
MNEEIEKWINEEADKLFPPPSNGDFVYGESFIIETGIVMAKKAIWKLGAIAMYNKLKN